MSSKQERIEELVSLYSLGTISSEELGELESYIEQEPEEVRKLISDNEHVAEMLSINSQEVHPPSYLKEDIMRRVRIRKNLEGSKRGIPFIGSLQPLLYGAGGAVAAAILIFLFSAYFSDMLGGVDETRINDLTSRIEDQKQTIASLENELEGKENTISELRGMATSLNTRVEQLRESIDSSESRVDELRAQLDSQREEINSLTSKLGKKNEQLAKYDDLVQYLQNPNVLVVDLGNLKSDFNSAGRVLWNKQMDSAIFYGINLPQVPKDKIYQLWAIIDSKPVSCGVFNVDQQGNGKIKIQTLKDSKNIQKFAVTLEPAGGVPSPTGEMYLAGGI